MTSLIRDPDYPGLAPALDTNRVLESLRAALPECRNGTSLLAASVVDVRYRPGGPCWVLYNLKLRHGDARSVRQLVSGRVLRVNEVPERPPEELLHRYRQSAERPLRTPVVTLPGLPLVAYAFPVDSSLPGLFDAADGTAMRHHLADLWADRKVRVRQVRVRRLGYTPHARAAFAYEILSEARGSRVPELRRLVGKMHAKKECARLFADAWAVWRMAKGRVNLAPPVGYLPAAGLTLQEMLSGTRLGGLVEDPRFGGWVRRAGRMLAELHALDVPLSSRRRPAEEAQTIHRWAGVLATIRPDLGSRVERLRDRLIALVLERSHASAPIHADFHHTNVLVDGETLTFIDLDEAAFGDPMLDVGRFLASLRIPARRALGRMDALGEAGAAFLEAYLRHRPSDERRARLFEAASLLIAAASAFRIQRSTWVEEVELLIGESERILALACRGEAVGGHGACPRPAGRPEGSQPEKSGPRTHGWIRDGVFVQALLAPHLKRVMGIDAAAARVNSVREERGSVEYRLRLGGNGRGHLALQGTSLSGGGRALLKRLETTWALLEPEPTAVRLPRPIAYLSGLSLLVCQPPEGDPLVRFADSNESLKVADALARGLVRLHDATLEFGVAPLSLDEEMLRLGRRIAELDANHPEFAAEATGVLAAVDRAAQRLPVRFGPALRIVPPRRVIWNGHQAGLARVDDIGIGHPLGDAADFVARCCMIAARDGPDSSWAGIGRRFRETYVTASGFEPDDLALFEATALVRLATNRACRGSAPDLGLAHHLLAVAENRLVSGGLQP